MPHLLVALTLNLPWFIVEYCYCLPSGRRATLADVRQAVTLASRVFAAHFVLQATIAWIIARRNGNGAAVAGFTGSGAMMATVAVFGLPL